ncbi:MAG: carboxyltransferase domain-containing protein [Armatimonadota bacterium]
MRIDELGESAYILRDLEVEPYVFAYSIELMNLPGVEEVIASVDTVGLYIDPETFSIESLNSIDLAPKLPTKEHKIPLLFDGSDLKGICRELSMEPEAVSKAFCAATYTVQAIGFLPGFPYLKGLPEIFHRFERIDTPRIRVPRGAVGIAKGQTGIYPQESPGGWNLIGTTPILVADAKARYFPLNPGDTIKFFEIDGDQARMLDEQRLTSYEMD